MTSLQKVKAGAPRSPLFFILGLLTVAGCERPDPRPSVEIVTRAGADFVIAHVELNYERICAEGAYKRDGDPEAVGPRIFLPTSDELTDQYRPNAKAIPWRAIASVSFDKPNGATGGYCADLPNAVMADVVFADGRQERQNLLDTTDRGLSGVTDHGPIVVPLREIASLKLLADGHWPWVDAYDPIDPNFVTKRRDSATLRISTIDGSRHDMAAPWTEIDVEKMYGSRSLDLISTSVFGLPILRDGAQISIPWTDLSHVAISNGRPQVATLAYNDGRIETGTLPTRVVIGGGSSQSLELANVAAIDVSISAR